MGRPISHLSRTDLSSGKRNFRPSSQRLIGLAEALSGEKSQPGILISDQIGRILYVNEAAQRFLDTLEEKYGPRGLLKNARLRKILLELLSEFKRGPDLHGQGLNAFSQTVISRNFRHKGIFHQIRSIPLKPHGRNGHDPFLLILIEKIPESIS